MKPRNMIVLVIILLLGFTFIMPFKVNDIKCYKEIAEDSCLDNYELTRLEPSNQGWASWDFICCLKQKLDNPRELNTSICMQYAFLEEDHNKCSKRYQFWRRTR